MNLARDQQDLQLIRASEEHTTVRIIFELEKRLIPYIGGFGRKYLKQTYDLAVLTICIVIEKEQEVVLTCELMTYLYRIARNQWTKIKPQVDQLVLNDGFLKHLSVEAIVYEEIEENERKQLVNRVLSKLDERCQRILNTVIRELCSREAAKDLAYKSEKVYLVKKSECLKKMKIKLWKRRECREMFGNEEDL